MRIHDGKNLVLMEYCYKHFIITFCTEVAHCVSREPSLDILTYFLFNSEINSVVLMKFK